MNYIKTTQIYSQKNLKTQHFNWTLVIEILFIMGHFQNKLSTFFIIFIIINFIFYKKKLSQINKIIIRLWSES